MRAKSTYSGLRALTFVYMASASAFAVAIVLHSNPQWGDQLEQFAQVAVPAVKSAPATLNEYAVKPTVAWVNRMDKELFAQLQTPKAPAKAPVAAAKQEPVLRHTIDERRQVASAAPPTATTAPMTQAPVGEAPETQLPITKAPAGQTTQPAAPQVLAQSSPRPLPPAAPAQSVHQPAIAAAPQVKAPVPAPHEMQLAETADVPPAPAPDPHPPSPLQLARVMAHFKVSLTPDLQRNFDLFLYVSKADHGPWAQRMYVFQKQASGELSMLYTFPVSTGREALMPGPKGNLLETHTPQGYYQFDPGRMYKRYHSHQWDQSMPYAMFFNWEHDGVQTGLAVHAATGDDLAELGSRSSAGCVRLDPRNAALLFNLVRTKYRGLAPRFAYDRRTATMANSGLLMHDKAGNVEYHEGYKVLVFIENNGGDNIVAALF